MDAHDTPVVATADARLLEEVLRLCAAVGLTPDVAGDLPAARRAWTEASFVIVGADLVAELAESPPRRRDGVVVVGVGLAPALWPGAIALGAERVIELPAGQDELISALADAVDGGEDACLVAVVGGAGGAGASTVAGALALLAADRGLRSLLIDADPMGGGIEVLMGSEDSEGLRWADVAHTHGRISGDSLRRALPVRAGLSTLSCNQSGPRVIEADAMRAVLAGGRRRFDLIVVDVPRFFDDAASEAIARAVLTVLVVPEDVRALASALRVLERTRETGCEVGLVTRTRPHGLGADVVARRLGVPALTRIRHDNALPAALDAGYGPLAGRSRSLRRSCGHLLDTLGLAP